MPRGTADATRHRILTAADRLFYTRGINDVSIDEIAAAADLTKNTIYYHFSSKDELVRAYLERRDETTLRWLIDTAEAGGEIPSNQMNALFDSLKAWARTEAFGGCPFLRAASDLHNRPTHPALAVGTAHKRKHREWLTQLARRAEVESPETVGRQLLILIDGAIADTVITGDLSLFDAARHAAAELLGDANP